MKKFILHGSFLISIIFIFPSIYIKAFSSEIELPTNPNKYISEELAGLNPVQIGDSLLQMGIKLMYERRIKASFEFFNRVLQIGQDHKDYRLEFLAINNMGLSYYYSYEYGKALNYFNNAYEIATTHLPTQYELTTLNNISVVYNADGKVHKALHFLTKAYEKAIELKLEKKVAEYGINLGTMYIQIGEYENARRILENSIAHSESESSNYYLAKISLSESFELEGDNDKALKILNEIIKNKSSISDDVLVFAFTRAARILIFLGKLDYAFQYASEAVEISKRSDQLVFEHLSYSLLSDISASMEDYRLAYDYLLKTKGLYAKIENLKNSEMLAEVQAKFELSRYEYELAIADEKYGSMKKRYTYIVVSIFVIGVLLAYSFRIRLLIEKQKNILLHRKEQIAALELENVEAQRMALEQEIMYNEEQAALNEKLLIEEIDKKNKEVASKLLVSAAKTDIINQVIAHIEKVGEKGQANINAIKNELKNTINIDKDWDDFIVHFEQTHGGFFQKLLSLHPSLNSNDLRFAAYLKINLSSKEIARLLNITPSSYRKRKMRLKEKLHVERELSLENYINNL